MTEIESLVARSAKYLHSAELLLDNGDYESVFVLSEDEAREILEKARGFTDACLDYLKRTGNL